MISTLILLKFIKFDSVSDYHRLIFFSFRKMPKSAKKRKAKTADFQKTKLKVGKGKVAPSNATNTTASVRNLQMTAQFTHVDIDSER